MNESEIRATALRAAINLGIRDPGEQAKYVDEYTRGFQEAIREERERCKAILNSPEAVGRDQLAVVLACKTDLPAGQAINLLQAAPLGDGGEERFAAGCVDFLQHLQASKKGKR